MTKQIPLPNNKVAIVDDEDFERVAQLKWYFGSKKSQRYPHTSLRRGDNSYTRTSMHRFIMQCAPHMVVDHINHDVLDNRRCNLRVVSRAENNWNRVAAKSKRNTGYFGVEPQEGHTFRVVLKVAGKVVRISGLRSEREAACWHDVLARLLRPIGTQVNFTLEKLAEVAADCDLPASILEALTKAHGDRNDAG